MATDNGSKTNATETKGKGKSKDKPALTPAQQMQLLLTVCLTHASAAERGLVFGKIKQGGAYQSFLDFWCGVMGNARAEGIKLVEAKVLENIGRTPNSSTVLKIYHLLRLYAPTMLERIERDDATVPAFAYDGLKALMLFVDREDQKAECNTWVRKTEQGGVDVPQEAITELLVKFITRESPTVASLALKVNALLGRETPERKKDKTPPSSAGELSKLPNGVVPTEGASKTVEEDKESIKIVVNGGTPATTEATPPATPESVAPATPEMPATAPVMEGTQTETNGTTADVASPTIAPPPAPLQDAAVKGECKAEDPGEKKPHNRAFVMVEAAKTSQDEGATLVAYGERLIREGRERGTSATDFLFCIVKAAMHEANKEEREKFARSINGVVIGLDAKDRRNPPIPTPVEVGEG